MAYWRSKILGAEIGLNLVSFFCTMIVDHGFVSYNNSDIRLPLFWNPSLDACLHSESLDTSDEKKPPDNPVYEIFPAAHSRLLTPNSTAAAPQSSP